MQRIKQVNNPLFLFYVHNALAINNSQVIDPSNHLHVPSLLHQKAVVVWNKKQHKKQMKLRTIPALII